MENFIHKYLSKHFIVSNSEESGTKIQLLVTYGIYHRDDKDGTKHLYYPGLLIKEISDIFGIVDDIAKTYIINWATTNFQIKPHNLDWYWQQAEIVLQLLPSAIRVAAKTIASDLVSVKPLAAPKHLLTFAALKFDELDANGDVFTEDAIIEARKNYLSIDNTSTKYWDGKLYSEAIQELLRNQQAQKFGVSSRKKDD